MGPLSDDVGDLSSASVNWFSNSSSLSYCSILLFICQFSAKIEFAITSLKEWVCYEMRTHPWWKFIAVTSLLSEMGLLSPKERNGEVIQKKEDDLLSLTSSKKWSVTCLEAISVKGLILNLTLGRNKKSRGEEAGCAFSAINQLKGGGPFSLQFLEISAKVVLLITLWVI